MSSGFWHGKKVFITGHTGFKGAWLTSMLLDMGARVTGYSLPPPTSPNLFELLHLSNKITHIEGDIRNRSQVMETVRDAKPDILFHLAAQALVRESYANPLDTFDTNTIGTLNILEATRYCSTLRSCVIVTTDKCYLNNEAGSFFKETDALGGKDPYSASKAAAEIICHAYYESFLKQTHIPMATARAGNVIGGGDWAKDRLIPDVFRAFLASKPVLIRNPAATRPWQHVLEPLRGYMLLAEKLFTAGHVFAGAWNFGPQPSGIQSVEYVLSGLKKILPFDLQLDRAPQPEEAKTLALDIHKASEKLGWTPCLNLDQTVQWTAEWYSGFAHKSSPAELTRKQISDYWRLA
ncbi:MAG: CDP-glucose 4,6-dehydratase [Proteobacteria bacterium]|nr:CDP-glucose 4,6-dehydratase [Pseudomonadota bacterium]